MDSLSLQLILEAMSIPDGIPYSSKKNKVLNETSEKTRTTKIDQSGRSPQRGSPKLEKSPTPKRGSPHQSDQSVDSVDFKEKRIENRKEGRLLTIVRQFISRFAQFE